MFARFPFRRILQVALAAVLVYACDTVTGPDRTVEAPGFLLVEPVSSTSMRLQWPRSANAGYRIERRANLQGDFSDLAIIAYEDVPAGDTVSFFDRELTPGTFYGYRVRAVGALGAESAPSVVSGARTAPSPGLDVSVTTNNAPDERLYVVRAVGPQGEFSGTVPATGESSLAPLARGVYEVTLDGLAAGCFISGSTVQDVTVTDDGLGTRARVSFIVNCKDPTKGEIHVGVLTLGSAAQPESYLLRLTGIVDDTPVTDTIPLIPRIPGPATGRFVNLSPGSYDVSLARVDETLCSIDGPSTVQGIQLDALETDSVSFTVFCEETLDGHPLVGEWLRDGAPVTTVQPGQNVTLRITAEIPDSADLSTLQGQLTWDPTLLNGIASRDYDTGAEDLLTEYTGNLESGRLRFVNLSLAFPDPANGSMGVLEIDFEALREGLAVVPLQIALAEDVNSNSVDVAPDIPRLAIQLGSGTVPPVARPGGPYTGRVGNPITFDGSTSSDPDGGSIAKYVWRFGDGTADSVSGAMPQHTYGTTGSFTVQLEVEDDEGERGSGTAVVTVSDTTSGGGGDIEVPEGNVIAIWTDAAGTWVDSAGVGDAVFLQICTPLSNVTTYQGELTDIPEAVASVSGVPTDLNATTTGAGPCASTGTDIIDQFTANPASPTYEHLNITLASAPGSGPQGLARIPFLLEGDGVLQPTLTVPPMVDFMLQDVVADVGVQPLKVGSGGSGGGGGGSTAPTADAGGPYSGVVDEDVPMDGSASAAVEPATLSRYIWSFGDGSPVDSTSGARPTHPYAEAGTYEIVLRVRDSAGREASDTTVALVQPATQSDFALSSRFSVERATAGDSVTVTLRTRPGQAFRSVDTRFAWGGGNLLFLRSVPGPAFDFTFQADALGLDSMRIAGTATSPLPGTAETTLATLVFRVSGSEGDTVRTRSYVTSLRDGNLRPIAIAGLPILEDTLPILPPAQPPIVQANGPYSGRVGETIGFSASGSRDPDGTIASFAWDFGDGTTGTGPAPQHAYDAVGTYPVILRVTDSDGIMVADTTTAAIRLTDPPTAVANGPYRAVAGTPISLSAAGSADTDGSIVSFTWDLGEGGEATGPAPSYTYSSIGTFPVRLTVTDNAGATATATTSALITEPPTYAIRSTWTVPSAPVAGGPMAGPTLQGSGGSAGPGDVILLRVSAKLDQSITTAAGTIAFDPAVVRYDSIRAGSLLDGSFQGSSPQSGRVTFDGQSGGASTPGVEAGLADVYFTVVGLDGMTTTTTTSAVQLRDGANQLVDLDPLPVIEGVFVVEEGTYVPANRAPTAEAGGPYSGVTGQAISFSGSATDSDGSVRAYDWDFGDGTVRRGAGPQPSHSYALPGTYTVRLTVVDDDGALGSDVATATITGEITNQPPTADPGSGYTGQAGTAIAFDGTGSADSDGTIASYAWTFGDGGVATGATPSHTYATAGAYQVTLTVTDDEGASSSASVTATVTEGPNQEPVAAVSGPGTGETGQSLSFSGTGSSDPDGSIASYAWTFGDGTSGTGASVTKSYGSAGTYTVELTVTDDDGATATASASVVISDAPNQDPVAAISGPTSGVTGGTLTFSGAGSSDPDGSVASFAWDFGDGTSGTGETATKTWSAVGTYTVTLTVTDNDGATDATTTSVTISEPTANVVGVWRDAGGNAITTASAGQTVYLQICTVDGDVSGFQGRLQDYPGTLALGDVGELDSVADGVGACANGGGADILNQYTESVPAGSTGINIVNVTVSPTAGVGPQGVAEYTFASVSAGSLAPTLVVPVFDDFGFVPRTPIVSIPALVVQ